MPDLDIVRVGGHRDKAERRARKARFRVQIQRAKESGEPAVVPEDPIPLKSVTPKTGPTDTRISSELKDRLTASNRAIYVALPKAVRKRRNAAFNQLRSFLGARSFRGLQQICQSGKSFYALVFDTSVHRDKAVNKFAKLKYKFEGVDAKLIAYSFGNPQAKNNVVWQVGTDPLVTGPEMVDAIISQIKDLEPSLTTQFGIRPILDCDFETGRWAVKFNGPAPTQFRKQLHVGTAKLYITQEPFSLCRFCGNSGHNLFDCTIKSDKELGEQCFLGDVNMVPTVPDLEMGEAEESGPEAV